MLKKFLTKMHKLSFRSKRHHRDETQKLETRREAFYEPFSSPPPPVFAVGTGRCGTHFLARLLERDPRIVAYHTDNIRKSVGDSFLRYCLWNNLPVDMEGFFSQRQHLIDTATDAGKVYFESNAFLSSVIVDLFKRFQAKFVYMIRQPEDVVNSHYVKGWYQTTPVKAKQELSLGFQYDLQEPQHFFSRIVPHGEEFLRWQKLTRIGKISWMWNTINVMILHQLDQLPKDQYLMARLEDVDYIRYCHIHQFVGGVSPISSEKFDSIRKARPGKGPRQRRSETWSEQERQEFLAQTQEARALLHYS